MPGGAASGSAGPRSVVLGDLALDVVVAPRRPLERGTDVPGLVSLRQGGSAATTARWLARLGARSTLICAVGRDAPGRALVGLLRDGGLTVHAVRPVGSRTCRIAVVVDGGGERSFVADRAAADLLAPEHLRAAWFSGADVLHLPAYSLLGDPLGRAGREAVRLARAAGAQVSLDLASAGPLLAKGRAAALTSLDEVAPAILFATLTEAETLLDARPLDDLLDLAPLVVIKRGPRGATVLAREGRSQLRFEVATRAIEAADPIGAGDAFDAGFLVAWLGERRAGASIARALQRAAMAGHRAAARHLAAPRVELAF